MAVQLSLFLSAEEIAGGLVKRARRNNPVRICRFKLSI
jgi:hypothetical protein